MENKKIRYWLDQIWDVICNPDEYENPKDSVGKYISKIEKLLNYNEKEN